MNGTFRGFGFTEEDAASETKEQVQKAFKPYSIQDNKGETALKDSGASESKACKPESGIRLTDFIYKNESPVLAYESVPKQSTKRPKRLSREQESEAVPSLQIAVSSAAPRSSMFRSKWKIILKGLTGLSRITRLNAISQVLGRHEREMEIGYPMDVKHLTHIGWDGPSTGVPKLINELKPALEFSSEPSREFGQPRGADWIQDASSAAKQTTAGIGEDTRLPPNPPLEYLDPGGSSVKKKKSKWNPFGQRQKSLYKDTDNCFNTRP